MAHLLVRFVGLVLAVVVLNFLLPRALPGDPLDASGGSPGSAPLTAAARASLRASYHLDEPLGRQLVAYLQDLVSGDLGWSISRSEPVRQAIGERMPWTLGLVGSALVIASLAGATLGLVGAWRHDAAGRVLTDSMTALAAMPEFLVASGLLVIFAVGLRWFPLQGGRSPFGPIDPLDLANHLALPLVSLVVVTAAPFALVTSGAMRALLRDPYLLTARGKGLSERRVAFGHAAPNALQPVLTLFGIRLGQVLGGAVVVERVFGVPGVGLLAFEAIGTRDYPLLQGIFLLGSLSVLVALFGLELIQWWLAARRRA
jgi:peptide/nickel transport system permease protein